MVYEIQLLKGQSIKSPIRGEKVDTFVGTLKFGELVNRYLIPYRDHLKDTGYQRKPTKSRVNKLARDLNSGIVDLPTAILLSVRDQNLCPQLDSYGRYIMALPENGTCPFYVIDGQHRLEALKRAMNDNQDKDWFNFIIPAVIICGADEDMEMDQFHTVNSNAKSIATGLALELLKKRATKQGVFRKYLDSVNEGWKVVAQDLTEEISKRNMWKGRIRFANQPKGRTFINSNSFVRSLRRALEQENFATYTLAQRVDIIDAYWEGISYALPECFESPDDYNIQKTVGVSVLHHLLPTVLGYAVKFNSPVYNADTYRNIFGETLQGLAGDNQLDGEVNGSEFWKVGREGASGAFSGVPGQGVLREKLRRDLQENLQGHLG